MTRRAGSGRLRWDKEQKKIVNVKTHDYCIKCKQYSPLIDRICHDCLKIIASPRYLSTSTEELEQ